MQATQGTVAQDKIAAMGARDITRNSKSQPGAAALQIAALIEPVERAEGFLPALPRNARPVIVHQNFHMLVGPALQATSTCLPCFSALSIRFVAHRFSA